MIENENKMNDEADSRVQKKKRMRRPSVNR